MDRSLELCTQLGWQQDPHLGHVDLKERIELGPEVQGRSGELGVLVDRPNAAPTSALYEAVRSIDVQPLLSVPLLWPTESLELGDRGEQVSRWKYIALELHRRTHPACDDLEALRTQFHAVALGRCKRIPRPYLVAIDGDGHGYPTTRPVEEAMEHHAEVLRRLQRELLEATPRPSAVDPILGQDSVEAIPQNDGSGSEVQPLVCPEPLGVRRWPRDLPPVNGVDVIDA